MAGYEIDFIHPALDLANSQHGRGPDLLEDARWFERYRAHWGYVAAGPPGASSRTRLLELRVLLRRISETLDAGKTPEAADLAQLDRVLGGANVRRELSVEAGSLQLRLAPARPDWRWVLSEIASSFVELLARGEADRLKVCDNPECRFVFYDASKNRSRRWCAHTTCGNRHKVRRFRERQRARARSERPPS